MYKIIGIDGRQYGPVSVEQLRVWLSQNRVNAHSMAQKEGSAEWKPLISFPELAGEFKIAPPPLAGGSNPRASNKIAAGVCGILLGGLGVHKFILGYTGAGLTMLLVSVCSCGILLGIVQIVGLIEGIVYLCKSDDDFVRTYVDNRREWF